MAMPCPKVRHIAYFVNDNQNFIDDYILELDDSGRYDEHHKVLAQIFDVIAPHPS